MQANLPIGAPRKHSPPLGSPARVLKPRNTEIPLSPKTLSRGCSTRARVPNLDFSTTTYTSRMRKQYGTSRGEAVKLGPTNILQVGTTRLSALPCVQGERADAGRSAHSLSVDWQAWGTKGGLCWRATRDGLRHGPAGPPNRPRAKTPHHPIPETSANSGSPRVQPRSQSSTSLRASRRQQRRKPHFQIEIHFCDVPHLPGPEKTRSPTRAVFPREGLLGLPLRLVLGLGFAQLIPTHQVTRGNQSKNSDYLASGLLQQ